MNKKGFTLVELLAVLALMALILVILIPNLTDNSNEAKEYVKKAKIKTVETNVLADANKKINEKSVCTGTIASSNTTCVYDAKTYLQKIDSKDNSLDGKVYICYSNSKLKITAHYSTESSYDCVSGPGTDVIGNVVNGTPSSDPTCANTIEYDTTSDHNYRYVGENPCNYVSFNGENPVTSLKWVIKEASSGMTYDVFDTESECRSLLNFSTYSMDQCVQENVTTGGWRIIGLMNNVDDGTGKKESRLKIIRNSSLGDYSWDTSSNGVDGATDNYGVNDWSKADLMKELNGDYLNTNLTSNTTWYNDRNNGKSAVYNYTKGLKASAQNLIGDAKWFLGSPRPDYEQDISIDTSLGIYESERSNNVYGTLSFQTCNDGACPRATEWTGKVGLAYMSDIMYSVGGSNRNVCVNEAPYFSFTTLDGTPCSNDSWIFKELKYSGGKMALTPAMYTNGTNSFYYIINSEDSNYRKSGLGFFTTESVCYPNKVYPTVYLKSSVKITGGDGTPSNPFTLA